MSNFKPDPHEEETNPWRRVANSCDNLLRAVMEALGTRPDQDPVIEAGKAGAVKRIAEQAGLEGDDIENALMVGARFIAHGFSGYEIDEMILNHYRRKSEIEVCTGVVAEEPEGEHVFIERYGMYHAHFGGIGGDVASLGLTREAWKAMGEPDVLAVSWVPVNG